MRDRRDPFPQEAYGLGSFVVDEREGPRIGRVFSRTGDTLMLRRPGGSRAWFVPVAEVRLPTAEEWASIRVLTTPVPGGSPHPVGFVAEVFADGPVYGTGAGALFRLGLFKSPSPEQALRWLRREALRIADRLDVDPEGSGAPGPVLRRTRGSDSDCPTEIRRWVTDSGTQQEARERLRGGSTFLARFRDTDCDYALAVWFYTVGSRVEWTDEPGPISLRMAGRVPAAAR
ncbi:MULTISPECIES: hypothetical protein [unclassified Streptomyces]|uniref:hypothetical protein n=1 Tax=unclassified Streptomyces TaxID=2593676 RepID=UPI001660127B|nr:MULTISPECIES: hypothetical protein [unclassified Streptomyces]MBD0709564.1 hypothetical protein [Streptomyces sp. CBMA291]MBD0715273.1 hypothetical protein [Streptomyces sp. CBMA370]MBD0717885.1 hypothetical protein [Streptomyces sp. CBMA370]